MKLKRTLAAVVAAVMAFTAVATPLGDNLPAVRDSVSITAEALSVGDIDNKMQQLSQKYPNGANGGITLAAAITRVQASASVLHGLSSISCLAVMWLNPIRHIINCHQTRM